MSFWCPAPPAHGLPLCRGLRARTGVFIAHLHPMTAGEMPVGAGVLRPGFPKELRKERAGGGCQQFEKGSRPRRPLTAPCARPMGRGTQGLGGPGHARLSGPLFWGCHVAGTNKWPAPAASKAQGTEEAPRGLPRPGHQVQEGTLLGTAECAGLAGTLGLWAWGKRLHGQGAPKVTVLGGGSWPPSGSSPNT